MKFWRPGITGKLFIAILATCIVLLQRMSVVRRHSEVRVAAPATVRVAADLQDVSLASDRVAWTPRELPRPLTASAGSRAASVLDEADARHFLLHVSPAGKALRDKADPLSREMEGLVLSALSEAERVEFRRLLDKVSGWLATGFPTEVKRRYPK